tara:strand:- start:300 stop:686 length:387 start_codon:yes stop_codon:yes gene_type:complete
MVYEQYKGGHTKVYMLYLVKEGKKYLKVGLTKFKDVNMRIGYNEEKDLELSGRMPWKDFFDEVKVSKSVTLPTEEAAKRLEAMILENWGERDIFFEENMSGISEMRKYSPEKFQLAKTIIDNNRTTYA